MQSVSRPVPLSFSHHGHGPCPATASSGAVIVGFRASVEPESPSKGPNGSCCQRRHSLLSDHLAADALIRRHGGGGAGATEDFEDADCDEYEEGESEDEDDEGMLDDAELELLEGLDAAWSPSSSIYSAGAASRASTASSSRPIAIPAAT